jgi:hypothetical protein
MKNIIGFIALITLLSGCGSSVENWVCDYSDPKYIKIDFENKTWDVFGTRVRPFNEFENKVTMTGIYKDLSPGLLDIGGTYRRELTVTLNRDTGMYTEKTGEFGIEITLKACSKI